MSSQYPHLDLSQRLFARTAARVHPRADCITLTTTAKFATETLTAQESAAALSRVVVAVKRSCLFNLALLFRGGSSLADALQRAAFAAFSQW